MLNEKIKLMLEESGISFKTTSKSFVLGCPRCRKKDKLYIRKTDGRFVCWVCKETESFYGHPEWALTELTGKSVDSIKAYLYGSSQPLPQFIDISFDEFFGDDEIIPNFVDTSPLLTVEDDPGFRSLRSPAGAKGLAYCQRRGIPLEIAEVYGIKAWPANNSIVFPVVVKGRQIGWQTRYIGDMEVLDDEEGSPVVLKIPKAMTSLGLKKERTFMFADRIIGDWVVLCEGPVDAIKAHECGGNVATLGKLVSRHQLELIKHIGIKRLYLALDPDAFVESNKVLREMSQYMDVYDMRPPPPYGDLGEMSFAEVRKLFEAAPKIGPHHLFLHVVDPYAR